MLAVVRFLVVKRASCEERQLDPLNKLAERPLMSLFIRRGRAKRVGDDKEVARLEGKIFELSNAPFDIVREFIIAMDVYEHILTERNLQTTRAIRTWRMVDDRGILGAIEQLVQRKSAPEGFESLGSTKFEHSFEAIVRKHRGHFSAAAFKASSARLK